MNAHLLLVKSREYIRCCGSSKIYKAAASSSKGTDIITGWIYTMISYVGRTRSNRIFPDGAEFTFSRRTVWWLVNWRWWNDNFGDATTMLRTFPCDITTTRFFVASLVVSKTIAAVVTSCITVGS